jgi:hypothetical protein
MGTCGGVDCGLNLSAADNVVAKGAAASALAKALPMVSISVDS